MKSIKYPPICYTNYTVKLQKAPCRLILSMVEFRSTLNLQAMAPNWVLALGNFDGVHLGHQALLGALAGAGTKWACPQAVVTFEPHPREFFQTQVAAPTGPWSRIWGSWDLHQFLRDKNIKALVEQTFDLAFSQVSAEEFLRTYIRPMSPKALVVGHDFAFGKGRQGSLSLLTEFGRKNECEIVVVDPVMFGAERVSTTQIKKYLGEPDLESARNLLGRNLSLGGPVQHGQARGRTIGVPTANVGINFLPALCRGVYVVRVDLLDQSSPRAGVANLGLNPTVNQQAQKLNTQTLNTVNTVNEIKLEAHLFDFSGDLYGRDIKVEFVKYLRPEKKFDNLSDLKSQILEDFRLARGFLQ